MFNEDKISKIPTEFVLFGHKYRVEVRNDLFEKENIYGNADDDLKLIKLQSIAEVIKRHESDGIKYEDKMTITPEVQIETFFHELVHIMLDAGGELELSENEKFVNMMGKALLQIYLSAKYEKPGDK